MSAETVEREYNNRALVPGHPAYFARWEKDSAFVRGTLPCTLDATLKTVEKTAGHVDSQVIPELKATLENARKTFESAQRTLSQDSPVQNDLRDALQEVSRASEALRALVDSIERQPDSLLRGKRLP